MPVNLPWMPSSDQFLRAIIAGSEISRRANQPRPAPHFSGGPGMLRSPAPQEEQPTKDPHYVLNGSILSYVDPNDTRLSAPEATPKPFDALGQKYIRDPITQQSSPFVPPSAIEKVGQDLVQVTRQPDTVDAMGNVLHGGVKVDRLYDGGNPVKDNTRISVPDTTGMSPDDKKIAGLLNPGFDLPRVSGSPAGVSNYFQNARSPFPVPVKSTEKVRVKSPNGQIGFVPPEDLDQALKEGYTRIQ